MFSRFFIDRPIFASVLSIVVTLAGGIALFQLPLAQYPPIAPPTIEVYCNYPGASATVVAEAIAAPIEQEVNGVEDMLYMSSQCANDGSYSLTVTFKIGVNLHLAQVLVQNRVNLALPRLPDVVKQTGVNTRKRSPDLLLVATINSPDDRYDQLYLSNFASLRIRDELIRQPGVSEVILFGQRDYSMRIWVDPDRMSVRNISASDVLTALREQNIPVAAGHVGQSPNSDTTTHQFVLTTTGRLSEVEQFEKVVIKRDDEGRLVYLKDIARVELGPRLQDVSNRFDGRTTVGLAVFQLPDANALETADRVKAKLDELSADFPEGIVHTISYDTSPFIRESIWEVFKALRDAILLVALVVLLFLQSWRAALIPLLAVPVAIVGTFVVLLAAGFSLNNLTLFGLVLAIGIVVDDAIVVVEAVEHHIEAGLSPREAAITAMNEVSGPVIAIGLVLAAVFVPCAFVSGIVGQFFRQFAVTIAIATLLSAFNSLTLSPALAAILLRPREARPDVFQRLLHLLFGWLFWLFNHLLRLLTLGYVRWVGMSLRVTPLVLLGYVALVVLTGWSMRQLPTGFIPQQDQGYLRVSIQLPDATAVGRTIETIAKLEKVVLATPGVAHVTAVAGNSFLLGAYGSNLGSMFVVLSPFEERRSPELSAEAIRARLMRELGQVAPEANVAVFGAPAVSGLGRAGGFKLLIEDRGEVGLRELQEQTNRFVEKLNEQRGISGAFTFFRADAPQLFADIDRRACLQEGVELSEVFAALQLFLGSRYINDFNLFGRTYQVVAQADSRFRDQVEDVKRLKVRNHRGHMVPLGSVCTVRDWTGPLVLTRYNLHPAAVINGTTTQGFSSGEAIALINELAEQELPVTMAHEWTEIYYLEQLAGNTGLLVFASSVLFVFLVLAAQYESWSLPLAVILVVPLCLLSSLAGVALARHDINIFTQIGFVVLVGLACKNAILLVEFAKQRREQGAHRREAALQACRLRLRPILMTSLAFILGVLPLVLAQGAGAEMRRVLGTAVFSGMLGVTLFGLLLTPVFFVVIDRLAAAPLFRSRFMQILSQMAFDLVTLGLPRLVALLGSTLRQKEGR